MKVLQVHEHGCFKGGIERYLFDMTTLLFRHGIACHGLFNDVADSTASSFTAPFASITTNCESLDVSQIKDFKAAGIHTAIIHKLNCCQTIKSILNEFRTIFVIHDHDYYCLRRHKYFPLNRKNCHLRQNLCYCSLCSLCMRKKAGGLGFSLINPLQHIKRLSLIKQADNVVVLSDFMKTCLLMNGLPEEKIIKVHPFAKFSQQDHISTTTPNQNNIGHLLYAGQLIRGKGVDLLLRSLGYLKSNYHLDIVGHGNDLDYLKQLAKQLNLEQNTTFHGFCSDLTRFYNQADVVLIPSRWQEPFGLVGLEAMSMAKPVIAFDVGGISEWLKDGHNGFLAPEGDIEMLASRTDQVLQDQQLAVKLGQNGLSMVREEYTEAKYIQAYKSLLEGTDV